jgi:crotonobetainyl-CoA:carnitine CoA-transferase CaiB-like acyl-CoA transferase
MIQPYRNHRGRDLKSVASPLRANGERLPLRRPPPRLGQHSREILGEFGLDERQVDALVERRVIFTDSDDTPRNRSGPPPL